MNHKDSACEDQCLIQLCFLLSIFRDMLTVVGYIGYACTY